VTTALDAFRTMMRDEIGPALRRLGFRGSGRSFVMPSDTHWVLLGFQKSRTSAAGEVRFTVNVTAASRRAWDERRARLDYLPERPSANTFYGPEIWRRRIGLLLPDATDRWWTLRPDEPTASVASQVVDAIRVAALPEIERRLAEGD
jgi:uncharacterized protein DUF4304